MRSNKTLHIVYALTFFVSVISAQFGKVEVTSDDRLLRDGDRQQLLPLKNEIQLFFKNTEWDDEYGDLNIPLHVQIIFEGTTSKGSDQLYLAKALFSNGLDQRYFDNSFQFFYNESGSLYFDQVIFEPLSSFLAYYAYLIIAGEADTYEHKGGNRFYETARSIAIRGASSDYPRGWLERIRTENILSSNHGLRKLRLATYYAMELFEYGRLELATKQFQKMIDALDEIHSQTPREHFTMLFLEGHADKLSSILSALNLTSILKDLMELNPDNRKIYERGLNPSSE